MLGNVLANLVSRPATRRYPFEIREPFDNARGRIEFVIENCVYCGNCARRCPAAAIKVDRVAKTLTFEPFRCIVCETCVEGCPKKAINTVSSYRAPEHSKETEVLHSAPAVEAPTEALVG
jgi:formate hydrogenlyase subunit 6/NADH:ubiquinone oxidoreductase subunit I